MRGWLIARRFKRAHWFPSSIDLAVCGVRPIGNIEDPEKPCTPPLWSTEACQHCVRELEKLGLQPTENWRQIERFT